MSKTSRTPYKKRITKKIRASDAERERLCEFIIWYDGLSWVCKLMCRVGLGVYPIHTARPGATKRSRFLLFKLFCLLLHFLVVVSVRWIEATHVGFRAHVKIASRLVSYRLVASRTPV